MDDELSYRAAHVVGHAFAAHFFGFEVEMLSLNGCDESAYSDNGQRLDEWTIVRPPECNHPIGTFPHTQIMENLTRISLSGPILELHHRGLSCTLETVQQFDSDWKQAWKASGYLWKDTAKRTEHLAQEIQRGATFLRLDLNIEYLSPILSHLSDRRTMNAEEFQQIIDQVKAKEEKRMNRPAGRPRKPKPWDMGWDAREENFFGRVR